MKFVLALITTFLAFSLSAQSLVFDRDFVSLNSIPCTFTKSGNWIRTHRQVRISCSVNGKSPVRIDSVYQYSGDFRSLCYRSEFMTWPGVCQPDSSYEIVLDVSGNNSTTFEFITSTGQRKLFRAEGMGPGLELPMHPPDYNHEQEMEGRIHVTLRELKNASNVPVVVDSIPFRGEGWSLQTAVPFVLAAGETKLIRFECAASSTHPGETFNLYFYVFHHRQNGLTEMAGGMVYLSFYNAVTLTGQTDQYFGRVKNGDTLRAEFTVQNNGTSVYDLEKNARAGVTFDSDSLKAGETSIAKVTWVVSAATDSFRMEIPLLNDVRNGYCIVVFHGVAGSHIEGHREQSVNPDTMIWVQSRLIDLDTLYKSQGELQYDIRLKNNSASRILVSNASTGDGGSFAEYPREQIVPGQEFTVRFVQDLGTGRSVINREVYIDIKYLDDPHAEIWKGVTIIAVVIDDTVK